MNPIPITQFYSSNIHFNIILHLRLGLPSGLLTFPPKSYMHSSSPPKRATCAVHLISLNLIILIIFDEKYKLRSSSLRNFLYLPFTSTVFGPNILSILLLETLFSWHKRQSFRPIQNHNVFLTADEKTQGSELNGSKHSPATITQRWWQPLENPIFQQSNILHVRD
jgi:hypothetical protein